MSDSPTLTLRPYVAADHDAVLELHRAGMEQMGREASGPWDTDLAHIEETYQKTGAFLVGECEGRIAAIGGLRMYPTGVGDLRRMRIHRDFHGRGFDQVLLDALVEHGRGLGARRLTIEVDERRGPAHLVYERSGFIRQGTLVSGGIPSIVFERTIQVEQPHDLEAQMQETVEMAGISGMATIWRHGSKRSGPIIVGSDIQGRPLSADSLYPTASLTKLAVALGILRLVDAGVLDLDAPLRHTLPELQGPESVTLRRLLCHTAGMPELPGVVEGEWQAIGRSCLETPPEHQPATRVSYSNHGYGLLGLALEQATGDSFGGALRQLVFGPLDLEAYVADELPREPVQAWRFRVLPAGGVFMSIQAALQLIDALRQPPAGFLSPALLTAAVQDQTEGLPGGMGPRLQWTRCAWGLGPEIRGDRYSPWIPPSASAASFGHAGASGCVAWADPAADTSWAILTVPPTDRATGVRWHLQSRPNLAEVGETILRMVSDGSS